MQDNFPIASELGGARNFEVITPDDVDLPRRYKAIYVGGDGNLDLVGDSDPAAVTHPVTAGQVLVVSPKQVASTTTATGLVGWW